MNHWGRIFKVQIFGASHGSHVGITIDGCPAGISIHQEDFYSDLERRKGGIQKATTPRKESDEPIIISGLFNGVTTGAPITILFENNNVRSSDYDSIRDIPRPGHADLVAHYKYHSHEDYRGGGYFSARLTTGIVAAGVIAKKIIRDIDIEAQIISIGGEKDIEKGIEKAIKAKDSVGGIINCTATNIPIGLGEPYFDSLESQLSHMIFSIPAVKGIEFGSGFAVATMYGSECNDTYIDQFGKSATNHSGGILGGISNGNNISFNIAIKPTSSTPQVQHSYNMKTEQIEEFSIKGRHDLCVALRAPVIVEAATAIVLADNYLIRKTQL